MPQRLLTGRYFYPARDPSGDVPGYTVAGPWRDTVIIYSFLKWRRAPHRGPVTHRAARSRTSQATHARPRG